MPASKDQFRQVMGQFVTGVTVVTTRHGDELHGLTANSVASVSLDPVLILVCIDHSTDTYGILKEGDVFAVNILSLEQEDLSRRFATKDSASAHGLENVPHRFAVTGAPIIEGCLGYLDCRIVATYPMGDHTIFIGRVEEADIVSDGDPLIFFRAKYSRLT